MARNQAEPQQNADPVRANGCLVTDRFGNVLEDGTPASEPRASKGGGWNLAERVAGVDRSRELLRLLAHAIDQGPLRHSTVFGDAKGESSVVDLDLIPLGKGRLRVELSSCEDSFRLWGTDLGEAVFRAGMGIMITDPRGVIQRVNPKFTEVTGFPPEEVVGRTPRVLKSGLQDETFYRALWQALAERGEWSGEIWNRRRSGEIYPEWLTIRAITDEGTGKVRHYVGAFSDLSRQLDLDAALKRMVEGLQGRTGDAFFREVAEQAAHMLGADYFFVGVLAQDRQPRVQTLAFFGEGHLQENIEYDLEGTPCEQVVGQSACTFRRGVAQRFPGDDALQKLGIEAYSGVPLFDSQGNPLGILVSLFRQPLADSSRTESLLKLIAARTASEIERSRQEVRIETLAYYDDVTQLANRALFYEHLQRQIALNQRNGSYLVLLLLDLDDFKGVNDSLGHQAGDRVLARFAQRLMATLRDEDSCARLGGDEFVILLPEFNTVEAAQRAASRVAQKITECLEAPFDIEGHRIGIQASVGIALFPADAVTGEELLKHADTAMYRAKQDQLADHRFFDPGMSREVTQRVELEEALREAIYQEDLEVYLQPRVGVSSLEVRGAEALVRWSHPEHGPISPGQFIPLAEESGLIHPLGRLVLEAACGWLAQSSCSDGSPIIPSLSINISPIQFRAPDFVDMVTQVIHRHGTDPHALELELTEGVLLEDPGGVVEKLNGLKALGVSISIDDFGTGYSSLAYLKDLPVDLLKIDRTFIQNLLVDAHSEAIVESIVALACNLGLGVCAEGIETEDQRQRLHAIMPEADFQGFLYSPALPPQDFPELVCPVDPHGPA